MSLDLKEATSKDCSGVSQPSCKNREPNGISTCSLNSRKRESELVKKTSSNHKIWYQHKSSGAIFLFLRTHHQERPPNETSNIVLLLTFHCKSRRSEDWKKLIIYHQNKAAMTLATKSTKVIITRNKMMTTENGEIIIIQSSLSIVCYEKFNLHNNNSYLPIAYTQSICSKQRCNMPNLSATIKDIFTLYRIRIQHPCQHKQHRKTVRYHRESSISMIISKMSINTQKHRSLGKNNSNNKQQYKQKTTNKHGYRHIVRARHDRNNKYRYINGVEFKL